MGQSLFENNGGNLGLTFLGSCYVSGGSAGTRPFSQGCGVFAGSGTCVNSGGTYDIPLASPVDPPYVIPIMFAEVGSTFTVSWGGQMSTNNVLIYASANVNFKLVLLGMPRIR